MPEPIPANQGVACRATATGFSKRKVHLIGIGGCGMSGAAGVLLKQGALVSGSDQAPGQALAVLTEAGATVFVGHHYRNLPADADVVVRSAAVPDNNPEVLAARSRGIPIMKYSELLGELMLESTAAAVAGTHGKSTTTAWTAFLAQRTGLEPSYVVGAEVPQLGGGCGVGRSEVFVAEACEYDRSFLNLAPTHAAILNIEEDHLDYFEDLEDIIEAFADFAALALRRGSVLYNCDQSSCTRAVGALDGALESFGLKPGAIWRARDLTLVDGLPSFDIEWRGQSIGRTTLAIPGIHNVYNALAACALTWRLGADLQAIIDAIGSFRGALRRLTHRGRFFGCDILDDYAHHPTEIRTTLQAVRQRYAPSRLRVVFQPHQVSRTRFFLEDFAESFSLADEVVVPDIYFVRDSESDRQLVCSQDLVDSITQRGGSASYIPSLGDIVRYLAEDLRPGDALLTMGAGDVWKVADEMVSRLRTHR